MHKLVFPPVDADAGVNQTDGVDGEPTAGPDGDVMDEDGQPMKPKSMKEKIGFRERKVFYEAELWE